MQRLGDNARRLLEAAGAPGVTELSATTAVWQECVGDAIARAAWPSRLSRDGTLHVSTTSSTWAFELSRLGGDITERLRMVLGDAAPQAIRFTPGPVPEPAAENPQPTRGAHEITRQSRVEGEQIAAAIENEELRKLVARAVAASLERARSDRAFC